MLDMVLVINHAGFLGGYYWYFKDVLGLEDVLLESVFLGDGIGSLLSW